MPYPTYIHRARKNVADLILSGSATTFALYAAQEGVDLPAITTVVNSRRRVKEEEYYALFPICVVAPVATKKVRSEDGTHFGELDYGVAVQVSIIGPDPEILTNQIELMIAALDYHLTEVVTRLQLLNGVEGGTWLEYEINDHNFTEIEFEGESEYRHTASLTLVFKHSEEGARHG